MDPSNGEAVVVTLHVSRSDLDRALIAAQDGDAEAAALVADLVRRGLPTTLRRPDTQPEHFEEAGPAVPGVYSPSDGRVRATPDRLPSGPSGFFDQGPRG